MKKKKSFVIDQFDIKKDNKLITYTFILMVVFITILIILTVINNGKIKTVNTSYFSLNYDSSWKIVKRNENELLLENRLNKSTLSLKINELINEDRYYMINDLLDNLTYQVELDYPEYHYLNQSFNYYSNNLYEGYQLLYESDNNELLKVFIKVDNYLYDISYIANLDDFDITLDSALGMIHNMAFVNQEEQDIYHAIKLDLDDISYQKSKEIDSIINNNNSYTIYNNNYSVTYAIPDIFKSKLLSSQIGYYEYSNNDGTITINTSVVNSNILEYLGRDSLLNIYQNYSYLKKADNFKESLSKIDNNKYLYHITYQTDIYSYDINSNEKVNKVNNEVYVLIYKLDRSHIFHINIESSNCPITEKLIKSISIDKTYNYAYYLESDIINHYLVSYLQRYVNDKTEVININLPENYIEIDKNNNVYANRLFATSFDSTINDYDYYINYYYTDNIDQEIDYLNNLYPTSYGEYQYLELKDKYNDYDVYEGYYTNLSGELYSTVNRIKYYTYHHLLVYQLEEGYLIISIKSSNKEIYNNLYKQVTNIKINYN